MGIKSIKKDEEFVKWYISTVMYYKNFSFGVKVSVPILAGLIFWLCYGYYILSDFNIWLLLIIIVLFMSTIGRCLFFCISPFKPKEPRLKK